MESIKITGDGDEIVKYLKLFPNSEEYDRCDFGEKSYVLFFPETNVFWRCGNSIDSHWDEALSFEEFKKTYPLTPNKK